MPQRPQLWTIGGLSIELGRNVRTVAKALQRVKPDGKLGKNPAWYMATAASALAKEPQRVAAGQAPVELEIAVHDLERISADLERGFDRLEAEPSVERRREMIKEFGHLVGDLNRAFEASASSENERTIYRPYWDKVVGGAINEVLRLCEWTLQPEAEGA